VVGGHQFERALLPSTASHNHRHARSSLLQLPQTGAESGCGRSPRHATRRPPLDAERRLPQGDVDHQLTVVEYEVVVPHGDDGVYEPHPGGLHGHAIPSVHRLTSHIGECLTTAALQLRQLLVRRRLLPPLLTGPLAQGASQLVELVRHVFRVFWRTADVQRRFIKVVEERG
jgi:hypothetical protein